MKTMSSYVRAKTHYRLNVCVCRNEIWISHEFNDFMTFFPGGQVISYSSYAQSALAHLAHRGQATRGRLSYRGINYFAYIAYISTTL